MAKKLNVMASAPENISGMSEIWGINELSAIADIRSELQITEDEARAMLTKATFDNPVKLKDVEFWVE